jgi:hypothetical protein
VLLMGYELYRLLATRTQRKKRKLKKLGPLCIDIEEEDKEKIMLEGERVFLIVSGFFFAENLPESIVKQINVDETWRQMRTFFILF